MPMKFSLLTAALGPHIETQHLLSLSAVQAYQNVGLGIDQNDDLASIPITWRLASLKFDFRGTCNNRTVAGQCYLSWQNKIVIHGDRP